MLKFRISTLRFWSSFSTKQPRIDPEAPSATFTSMGTPLTVPVIVPLLRRITMVRH